MFTATATSSDVAPDPEAPTITWSWRFAGSLAETAIGTGTSVQVELPLDGVPCAGAAYEVLARVNDGTTTAQDFITVTYFPLC